MVDDANNRPNKTIFCVLEKGLDKQMVHSLKAVMNLVESKGVPVFDNLEDVADYINKQ